MALSFSPNQKHSFYGMMHIYVETGNPTVNGATLNPGYSADIFAPIYGLPLTFQSKDHFSIRMTSLTEDILSKKEYQFYFPKTIPDGFSELAHGIYYSQTAPGIEYQQPLISFINKTISKKPSKNFVIGSKSVGKSTFSRYFANMVISQHGKVGFLDLDPGQPELSLPGSVSFSVLDNFILSPPERHTNLAQLSYFYGSTSISDNIEYFFRCVKALIDSLPSDIFIICNSFGWVVDLGQNLHQQLLDILLPENVIVLAKPNEKPPEIRSYSFHSEVTPQPGLYQITPKEQREIRFITHFVSYRGPISSQQPYMFTLNNLHIGFVCVEVAKTETLTALNGSIVALCSDMRKFQPNKYLVNLLRNPEPIKCVGYGLVRAIDKANGLIYIIATESSEDIATQVNTILMGPIQVPIQIFLDTPRADPNYLGIGLLQKAGASTDPLSLKQTPVFE